MRYVKVAAVLGMGLWALGCGGGVVVPTQKVASSEAAVRAAQEVGARDVPQAGQYLELAQNELEKGKALMRSGNGEEAIAMFDRAQADAEVALATTRETKTRMAAEETKARAQALRTGMPPGDAVGGGPAQPSAPAPAPQGQPAPNPPPAPAQPPPAAPKKK